MSKTRETLEAELRDLKRASAKTSDGDILDDLRIACDDIQKQLEAFYRQDKVDTERDLQILKEMHYYSREFAKAFDRDMHWIGRIVKIDSVAYDAVRLADESQRRQKAGETVCLKVLKVSQKITDLMSKWKIYKDNPSPGMMSAVNAWKGLMLNVLETQDEEHGRSLAKDYLNNVKQTGETQ